MATKREEIRGAPSVVTEDQTSFVDEDEGRRGRQFSGGKKELDLDHVGMAAPDSDGEGAHGERPRAQPRE